MSADQLPTDQQITNCLVGGLDSLWSAVRDAIVYSAKELSLDDPIGALEAHEVTLNGIASSSELVSASTATTKQLSCSNCGKRGHCSLECRSHKNHGKKKAGAATTVRLGGYDSGSFDDEDEINLIYE